jgi:hypothetical protein
MAFTENKGTSSRKEKINPNVYYETNEITNWCKKRRGKTPPYFYFTLPSILEHISIQVVSNLPQMRLIYPLFRVELN